MTAATRYPTYAELGRMTGQWMGAFHVPLVLTRYRHHLEITAEEGRIIDGLLSYDGTFDAPCPNLEALEKRTGLSAETILECLHALEARGLLRVEGDNLDVTPLLDTLTALLLGGK